MNLYGQEDNGVSTELGYWRKHPNLHGFVVQTFADGVDECQDIPLTLENLETILEATEGDRLPCTTGFFFGQSYPEQKPDTIKILNEAIEWLKENEARPGRRVFYRASW